MSPKRIKEHLIETLLRVPVSVKVMGIALGLTLLMGAAMLWQIHESWHRALLAELDERGTLLGTDLATHGAEHFVARHTFEIQVLLDEAQSRVGDVEYLMALDPRGAVMADTLSGEPSAELLAANGPGPERQPRTVRLDTDRGAIRDVAVPILQGQAGTIRVGMSERLIASEIGGLTRRLAVVTATVMVLGVLAALFLTAVLTRPIRELVTLTREVKEEKLDRRAVVRVGDELGALAIAFNEMTDSLHSKEIARQNLMRQVLGAAEEERKRVARELHDQTGQALTSLIAGLSALEADTTGTGRVTRLLELRDLAVQTLREIHDLSRALRPAALDDLGLMAALRRHCEIFGERFDLAVDCQAVGLDDGTRLPPEVELASYRIVQEALTNAVRHGEAKNVNVLVQRRGGAILLVIEDDGRGFAADSWRKRSLGGGHLGLLGIEERAMLLGGALRVQSSPGSGSSLFVELPLRAEDRDA